MIHGKNIIAISCCLALWCAALSISLITHADGEKDPEKFANHRVLKFYRLAKYGGKNTLFINQYFGHFFKERG